MLRSGVYLTGATRTLQGGTPPADLDDGVLTAYEATQLDLHGTELVVLSACETGLGKQMGTEGLVGLTRGFMYAGAPRVLASLWKVDDVATAKLRITGGRSAYRGNGGDAPRRNLRSGASAVPDGTREGVTGR